MGVDSSIVEQARNVDMIAFLERRCGFRFNLKHGSYRCQQHPSLAVNSDRRSWYWHSKGIGGYGAIDYLIKAESLPFPDAVEAVTGMTTSPPSPSVSVGRYETSPPKKLILPEKTGLPFRLYDYLCVKRGIDSEVVNWLIQKEMLYEDRRGNVVFIGYDELNKPRFACLRSTYSGFRGDCAGSDKRYSFRMVFPQSDQLYIFESPIDAMSHATIDNIFRGSKEAWKRCSRLSLAGTSETALSFFLNQHNAIKQLYICLDNDPPGRKAADNLMRKYTEKGYIARFEPPRGKDYNEELRAILSVSKSHKRANHQHHDVDI